MTLKKEIEEILHPERKDLHPPRAPKQEPNDAPGYYTPIVGEKGLGLKYTGRAEPQSAEPPMTVGKREPTDSKPTIDFNKLDPQYRKWCLSLETQRHYYYTKFGKTHREDSKKIKRDLKIRNQELDMVELLKREKAPLYRECMNELKEVLEKRKRS